MEVQSSGQSSSDSLKIKAQVMTPVLPMLVSFRVFLKWKNNENTGENDIICLYYE